MDVMMNTGPTLLSHINGEDKMSPNGSHSMTPEPSSGSTQMTRSRSTPKVEKQSVPEKSPPLHGGKRSAEDGSPMPSRRLRQRKSPKVTMDFDEVVEQAIQPLTEEERRYWKGWVELESEPVSLPAHSSTHIT